MRSILFDLDGTLTDSGEGIMNCAAYALEQLGIPVPSREEMRVFVGPPLHETFMRFGVPANLAAEAVRLYRVRYLPVGMLDENQPYPGIPEMLEALHRAGHRLYVATSKPETMAEKILNHFDLAKYFTRICGATMDASRTAKDAVIAYLMEETGEAGNMVMVGDTKFDILGARVHNIPGIGVSWGYGKTADMEDAGAVAIATSIDALFDLLDR